MTKPSEPSQHTAGAAEDPVLGRAVDAALDDARSRKAGPDGPNMVLGAVQAELAEGGEDSAVATLPPPSIDDLDASLAQAAAEATARLLEDADAPLAPAQPAEQPEPAAVDAQPAPAPTAAPDDTLAEAPPAPPIAETVVTPEPAQAEPAATEASIPVTAPAAEPAVVAIPLGVRVRRAAASVLDPLAERAERLPPGVRNTIGWIAVFTLLNAAGVWTTVLWTSAPHPGAEHASAAGAETAPPSPKPAEPAAPSTGGH